MQKITLFIIPTLLLLTGASCVIPEKTHTTDNASNYNTVDLPVPALANSKPYESSSMGLRFQYPEKWEVVHESEDAVSLQLTDNELIKQGTSAKDPNGIFFTLTVAKPGSYDHDLSLQRTKGTYHTPEEQKKRDAEHKASSFPQPVLAATSPVVIDKKEGYAYSVQVKPKSEEMPITELSRYYDGIEYYIPLENDAVLIVYATVGYGANHDALLSDVEAVVNTIQFQKE
jgi:hypothetical protein